uniref:Uncharacterized protein n=1 Tax=Strigamia maritima TaxID=126957 RepID=T1JDW4_STRMM
MFLCLLWSNLRQRQLADYILM